MLKSSHPILLLSLLGIYGIYQEFPVLAVQWIIPLWLLVEAVSLAVFTRGIAPYHFINLFTIISLLSGNGLITLFKFPLQDYFYQLLFSILGISVFLALMYNLRLLSSKFYRDNAWAPLLPHAIDVFSKENVTDLVSDIRSLSTENDRIAVLGYNPILYSLAERLSTSRMLMLQACLDIIFPGWQEELLLDLRRKPPMLIINNCYRYKVIDVEYIERQTGNGYSCVKRDPSNRYVIFKKDPEKSILNQGNLYPDSRNPDGFLTPPCISKDMEFSKQFHLRERLHSYKTLGIKRIAIFEPNHIGLLIFQLAEEIGLEVVCFLHRNIIYPPQERKKAGLDVAFYYDIEENIQRFQMDCVVLTLTAQEITPYFYKLLEYEKYRVWVKFAFFGNWVDVRAQYLENFQHPRI